MRHATPVKGCHCDRCEARRAYAREWHKDQRRIGSAYAMRQRRVRAANKAKRTEERRERERARDRARYRSNRIVFCMYESLKRRARLDPVWPWHRGGVSASDREKLMKLAEAVGL